MLNELVLSLQVIVAATKANVPWVLTCMSVIWGVHILNSFVGYRLNVLGIYPRKLWGTPGILLSPFLHGNTAHLFFNSVPMFVLISLLSIGGEQTFLLLSLKITVISGVLVWLFGRPAFHVGASSLLMGYMGYLLAGAWSQHSVMSVIVAVIALYYFGGMLMSVVPTDKSVSWEGHLFGLLAGIFVAVS